MSDKSDHLIERAAALLRAASASGADAQETTPPSGTPPSRPGEPPHVAPPSRPVPPLQIPPPNFPRSGNAIVSRHGSVADLRGHLTQPPVELSKLEAAGLMVARSGRTRTTEEYKIVIGRVLRALHEELEDDPGSSGCPNVVMITSARPGEGKSFTSLNLSGSIAQNAGESVLLIDVDAKHNSLTEHLGLAQLPGFLDMVTRSDLAIDDLLVPTDLPNLFILPLGSRQSRDGIEEKKLEERRLTPPIVRLSQRFPKSLIVLDAPPCLSTSDPHTLAPAVGQVIMVVEAERTQRNEVEGAIDLVRVCPNITMLLNKVRMEGAHTFGSYDYFGSYT